MFFIATAFATGAAKQSVIVIVVPCFMAVIGALVMKKLVWDLADEVYDFGEHLVVKNGGVEEVIKLADVMNVSIQTNMNPPRITLRLVRPSRFGEEVTFSPIRPFTLNPFAKNEVAEDLIRRVDSARSRRAV